MRERTVGVWMTWWINVTSRTYLLNSFLASSREGSHMHRTGSWNDVDRPGLGHRYVGDCGMCLIEHILKQTLMGDIDVYI
jgi:hypothetical protein